jgi:hypothetical protein
MFKPWFSTLTRMARGEEKEVGIVNVNTTLLYILEHKVGKTVSSAPFVSNCNALIPHS